MDFPEYDVDPDESDTCDSCAFEQHIEERIDVIEQLIIKSLQTKPLRKHTHRVANRHLHTALSELDALYHDVLGDD